MLLRPFPHGGKGNQQRPAEVGEFVLDVWRLPAEIVTVDQTVVLHRAQCLGQHLRRDAGDVCLEFDESQWAVGQCGQHEDRPARSDAV